MKSRSHFLIWSGNSVEFFISPGYLISVRRNGYASLNRTRCNDLTFFNESRWLAEWLGLVKSLDGSTVAGIGDPGQLPL
jgi:hypothetical protein